MASPSERLQQLEQTEKEIANALQSAGKMIVTLSCFGAERRVGKRDHF